MAVEESAEDSKISGRQSLSLTCSILEYFDPYIGVSKISRKTNISNPLIHTHTCAYQGVRNVSYSEILRTYFMDEAITSFSAHLSKARYLIDFTD